MSDNDAIGKSLAMIDLPVRGVSVDSPGGTTTSPATTPLNQGKGLAAQSIAQSMAIAVQDATDMLRNISTVETTAIGVATAKWIEMPENLLYKEIIDTCTEVIQNAAKTVGIIGEQTAKVLASYSNTGSGGGS